MQAVYDAENLIDAYLIKGLLEQEGITVYIRGEHLAGAMGELPAIGLIAVMVPEESVDAARRCIHDWDNARRDPEDFPEDSGQFLA